MKNRYNKTYRIYHLKELSLDRMISMYHEYANAHGFSRHQERKIYEGIEMLIHFIAQKQIARYDDDKKELGVAEINYDIADKVIGDVFQDVNAFLRGSGIIKCAEGYNVGTKSFSYIINPEYTIEPWYIEYAYPEKFYVRLTKALKDYKKKQEVKELESLSKEEIEFRKAYAKNLNKVKVVNKEGLKKYIDEYDYTYDKDVIDNKTKLIKHKKGEINENKKLFYQLAYETYIEDKHEVYKWDEYGRIHHFITNSPRGFRDYLNIWFHTDVHNCQPLLFSTLIYEYYNVSNEVKEFLSTSWTDTFKGMAGYGEDIVGEYNTQGVEFHYETRYNYNSHNNSELQAIKKEIDSIPKDVLEYLYLVMSGRLWDVLASLFNMKRYDVKGTMFAELFYSNAKGVMSWQEHGKIFKQRFPNVTKAIVSIRNQHEEAWLPKEMQRRESKIMRKVLSRLMKNGYEVISIHDAVLMLDTDKNRSRERVDEDLGGGLTEDNVERDVMLDIQWAYIDEGMGCSVGW